MIAMAVHFVVAARMVVALMTAFGILAFLVCFSAFLPPSRREKSTSRYLHGYEEFADAVARGDLEAAERAADAMFKKAATRPMPAS
jgi:DNA-binding FadR family transcriptional regulator